MTLLTVENLHVSFDTPHGESHTLRGIDFSVRKGTIFGIVGESGCGKSLTGKAILDLLPRAGRVTDGRLLFNGSDLRQMRGRERQALRGKQIGMVFQDPSAALNPVFTIEQQMLSIMRRHMKRHRKASKNALRERAISLLNDVGLPNPERILRGYPHEMSGGMQQRIMIGMALSLDADLLIADEPTSALDVTIQAQILGLLKRLRDEKGVTIMLITHDMGVVAGTCDEMAVFYAGQVVERGETADIFSDPKHPYTQGLLSAMPHAVQQGARLSTIPGRVPTGFDRSPGCRFAERCEQVIDVCGTEMPTFATFEGAHRALCHLYPPAEKWTKYRQNMSKT